MQCHSSSYAYEGRRAYIRTSPSSAPYTITDRRAIQTEKRFELSIFLIAFFLTGSKSGVPMFVVLSLYWKRIMMKYCGWRSGLWRCLFQHVLHVTQPPPNHIAPRSMIPWEMSPVLGVSLRVKGPGPDNDTGTHRLYSQNPSATWTGIAFSIPKLWISTLSVIQ